MGDRLRIFTDGNNFARQNVFTGRIPRSRPVVTIPPLQNSRATFPPPAPKQGCGCGK